MNKLLYIVFALFLSSCGLINLEKNHSLVSVDVISKKIKAQESVQLIDVRTADEYLHSHIPSARNVWRNDIRDLNGEIEGMRLDKESLEDLMGDLGLNSDDSIYLYDAIGNVDAARLWWMLKVYGFEKVALINGGFIQWRLAGKEVVEGPEYFEPTSFVFSGLEQPDLVAVKDDISSSKYEQIIDCRSDTEYDGSITKNGAIRGGHIPGAVQFDYMEMLDGGAFTFKSKEKILRLMDVKNLDRDKSTVIYCHRGVRSSLALFVLKEIVGMEVVANYDGSWIDWSMDESLPVEK